MLKQALTPIRIVAELDKYIIGQTDAKRAVAIALRNRWRRMNVREDMRNEIIPNNILMIGATGVGKTEIARRLAQLAEAPFIKVEASKFTEVGYVGRDVEGMVRDLLEQAIGMVKDEQKERVRLKAEENSLALILDFLLLSGKKNKQPEDDETAKTAREKLRQKLANGELEDRKIEIEVSVPTHQVQVMPMAIQEMENLHEMLSGMVPKKKKIRKMTVKEARAYFLEEESQKMIDMEAVIKEALARAGNSGIIFIDEIDKIATTNRNGGEVSREGVQRDLLPIVEGSAVNTKYGILHTDHILFIAAGAFHFTKPSDLIPELQGRFPIRVELHALTQSDFVKILSEPRNALTRQYEALLESEGVQISFLPDAIEEIAEIAFIVNQQVENIGARRLHTIMSSLLSEILFEVPDLNVQTHFRITSDFVKKTVGKLAEHKEISHYIL